MGLPQVAASDNYDAIDALMADMKNSEKDSVQGISFLSHVEQGIEKNTNGSETSTCVMTTNRMEWAGQGLDALYFAFWKRDGAHPREEEAREESSGARRDRCETSCKKPSEPS